MLHSAFTGPMPFSQKNTSCPSVGVGEWVYVVLNSFSYCFNSAEKTTIIGGTHQVLF